MKRSMLILSVLLASVVQAASVNLYRVRGAPLQPLTVVGLTNFSEGEAYPLNILRADRLVVDAHGVTSVAYSVGAFHALDGPEERDVHSSLGDFEVTASRVQWVQLAATMSRVPTSICYDIRAVGDVVQKEVATTDGFGTQWLRISRPETLCVPATLAIFGDPYYYFQYPGFFPIPPASPVRLCFKARAERPVIRPDPTAVTTFLGEFVARVEPVRDYCVDATVAPE